MYELTVVSPACKETVRSPIRLKRNNFFIIRVSGELFCDLFNGIVKGVNEILKGVYYLSHNF